MVSAYYLNEALKEAQKADPKAVRPNPLVGAVVVDENQVIVGRGYHQKAGTPHAEVHAIADAEKNGVDLSKCTIYVTLEPCSHHGKTPPCTDLILKHGIKKVVIGSLDPNPLVSGVELLRSKGVEVELNILNDIEELNRVFFVNQREQRPYFQFKMAMTSNGVYGQQGVSRLWISGPEAGSYVHKELRSSADAILSTAKSVINDNSKLNIRIDGREEERTAIILDQQLDLLKPENRGLLIFYPRVNSKLILVTTLNHFDWELPAYVEIMVVPEEDNGKISLISLSRLLYQEGYCRILIEAGYILFNGLFKSKLIDECLLFVAKQCFEEGDGSLYFKGISYINGEIFLSGFLAQERVKIGEDTQFKFYRGN